MQPKPIAISKMRLGSTRSQSRVAKAPRSGLQSRRLQLEPLEQRTLLSASISGAVFEDLDRDGAWDTANESGMEGWTVQLQRIATTGDLLQDFQNPIFDDGWGNLSVAAAGDNILIGAPEANPRGYHSGAACLYAPDGTLLQTFVDPNAVSDTYPSTRDRFGDSVAAVGDKVLVGAPGDDASAIGSGAAYLFDSATGELRETFVNPNPGSGDRFGTSVAAFGDNVLIAAPYTDGGALNTGAVFLFAQDGTFLKKFTSPQPAEYDNFGYSVAVMDNNILVTSIWKEYVYMLDGSTGELIQTFRNPATEDYWDDSFGQSIAAVGNNVLVGAFHDDIAGHDVGAAYLFDGSDGTLLHSFSSPVPTADEMFGCSVAGVGDDVLIGSRVATYLFDGSTGNLLRTYSMGVNADPRLGERVAAVGNNVLVGGIGEAALFEGVTALSANTGDGESMPLGAYSFTGVDPGTYQVRQVGQPGYSQTYPGGHGIYAVTVLNGETHSDLNFGNVLNEPPVAAEDSYSMDEDETLTVAALGVLQNDTDPGGDTLSTVLVRDAAHGTLALAPDGSLTYTPHVGIGFIGMDTFAYKAYDGAALSNTATVSINVNQVYDRTTFDSTDVAKRIPDGKTKTSILTVPADQDFEILDLDVQVDLSIYAGGGDLDVFLIGPDGTRVELLTDVGTGGWDFAGTVLDDEGAIPITAGMAPCDGSTDGSLGRYQPEGSLRAFDGSTASGDWTLEVSDDTRGIANGGRLNAWSITFTDAPLPPPPPGPPTIASLSDSPDLVKQGQNLTLTANGVVDDQAVMSVAFYRDDGDGSLGAGDELLGTDTAGGDGWSVNVPIASDFPTGVYTYFAQATDNEDLTSNIVSTTNQVKRAKGGGKPKSLSAGGLLAADGLFGSNGPAVDFADLLVDDRLFPASSKRHGKRSAVDLAIEDITAGPFEEQLAEDLLVALV